MCELTGFASHLLALEDAFATRKISTVYEFGMGFSSTPFLLKHVLTYDGHLISVEMQNAEWFERVVDEHKPTRNFTPLCMLGPYKAIEHLENWPGNFDLVFVDGHGDSRWRAVNTAFNKASLIIAHDTEAASYYWDRINVPSSWTSYTYKDLNTWTTVWTSDAQFLAALKARAKKRHF